MGALRLSRDPEAEAENWGTVPGAPGKTGGRIFGMARPRHRGAGRIRWPRALAAASAVRRAGRAIV